MLTRQLATIAPANWTIAEGEVPTEEGGVVTAWIQFETKQARCFGLIRLKDNKIWTLHEGVTGDQAQEHAIALLRCAAATAQETATHQHGSQRELTFALMHMMDMARALLEHKRAAEPGL